MPKRYLLYIHDSDQFDTLTDRGMKSGLVNQLLASHWSVAGDGTGKIPTIKKIQPLLEHARKEDEEAQVHARKLSSRLIKTPMQAKAAVVKDNFCEHGFAPGFCKKQKCKNTKRK